MTSNWSLTGNDVRQAVFVKPPLGKRGYNSQDVDQFMQRVAATLDGHGSVTADEVHNVVFPKPPIGDRGYHEDEVDAMLDLVASVLRRRAAGDPNPPDAEAGASTQKTEPLSGYQIRQTVFPNARIGTSGYDKQQVDDFMSRAADTLDGSGMPLSMDEVGRVSFDLAKRLRRGYHADEVDAMVQRIVTELRRRSAGW